MTMACFSGCSSVSIEGVSPREKEKEIEQEIPDEFMEDDKDSSEINRFDDQEAAMLSEFESYLEEISVEHKIEVKVQDSGFDRGKAEEAFRKVNEKRSDNGVALLIWDESLYELACIRAQEIVTDFSHQRPDGSYVGDVMIGQYGATGCGENIASNYKSTDNLINGWLNSQGHKENMLNSQFTAGVMACYSHNGCYYWVNLFKQ